MTTATETRGNTYEGLFLFPHAVMSDLQAAVDHLHELLRRAEAEIIAFKRWDERRLAYEIKGNKRGVYFLVYFRAPAGNMAGLERDCNLSEQLLRSLIIRADHCTDEQIAASDGRAQLADETRLRTEEELESES
jgi:ribosomal protein S6